MDRWYRGGRLANRKTGQEEPDYVEISGGRNRFCHHVVVPGLDPRFSFCRARCGWAVGPTGMTGELWVKPLAGNSER